LCEARMMGIEDAARNVQVGDGIAIVEQCALAPAPSDRGQ